MKKKKRRLKYKNILILGMVLLVLFSFKNIFKKEEQEKEDYTVYIGQKFDDLKKNLGDKITIVEDYQYNNEYKQGEIIQISEENEQLKVLVSKGVIDDNTYREKKVNELGKVPIMMYHGIINTKDNKYTGGNVDKDGYNRTSDAFRADLEFYYNSGYRMIRLADYVNGVIDVELGFSPIILTFDDGNKNNFNVLGRNSDGTLIIDPDCAVGILETFKKNHPDMKVTATFFVMENLFNQKEYNEEILNWLVDNGYDVGNHTTVHADFTKISTDKTKEVVGKMYQTLDNLIPGKYVKILALPFGSPYKKSHNNYPYILNGEYNGYKYETQAALRVGWEAEVSPFDNSFDKTFLKRCRAYDNNGKEFDIEMVFKNLEKNRYISDGDKELIVIKESDNKKIDASYTNVHTYKEG